MTWAVPNADAVTLGEMDGELLSVSPRDEAHVGDEFVRRGGTVFLPARVVCTKKRRPFGQEESLTSELGDNLAGRNDAGAVKLAKQAVGVLHAFLFDDEQKVIQTVLQSAKAVVTSVLTGAPADDDDEIDDGNVADEDEEHERYDERKRTNSSSSSSATSAIGSRFALKKSSESIAALSWHPTLSLLAVAQRDGVVTFYDLASASWDARVLEHAGQTDITSIEWARFSGGVIAVACRCVRQLIQPYLWMDGLCTDVGTMTYCLLLLFGVYTAAASSYGSCSTRAHRRRLCCSTSSRIRRERASTK